MHAKKIVQRFFDVHLSAIHAARRPQWADAVDAAMRGHALSLSRLARGVMRTTGMKAALKRMDRLIGSRRVEEESVIVGAALLGLAARMSAPVVIAVDWSPVTPGGGFVELRAAVTASAMGRAVTVYQQVHPLSALGNRKVEADLLELLSGWLPDRRDVVIVTDAGFRRPWFASVERVGWSWLGRVRQGVNLSVDGHRWEPVANWFAKARPLAKRAVGCFMSRRVPWACDLVSYVRRPCKRKRYGLAGHRGMPKARHEARASALEPWLLAHSANLRCYRPDEIVAMYARRMQIEESFRDGKSALYGLAGECSRSRTASRLQALRVVAAAATFMLWHIGQLAEAEGLHHKFKATTRTQRELSVITLGLLMCQYATLPLSRHAFETLQYRLRGAT